MKKVIRFIKTTKEVMQSIALMVFGCWVWLFFAVVASFELEKIGEWCMLVGGMLCVGFVLFFGFGLKKKFAEME
jgi:hypothetical protein